MVLLERVKMKLFFKTLPQELGNYTSDRNINFTGQITITRRLLYFFGIQRVLAEIENCLQIILFLKQQTE